LSKRWHQHRRAGAPVARVLEPVASADLRIQVIDTRPWPPSDSNAVGIFCFVVIVSFLAVFQVSPKRWELSATTLSFQTVGTGEFPLAGSRDGRWPRRHRRLYGRPSRQGADALDGVQATDLNPPRVQHSIVPPDRVLNAESTAPNLS
jgi:hypothetical protein